MTKVEVRYVFTKPFEDAWLAAIERLPGVYGLQAVQLNAGLEGLKVLYDATRLYPPDVDRELRAAGLPVKRAGA